jgi:hypothetical protein
MQAVMGHLIMPRPILPQHTLDKHVCRMWLFGTTHGTTTDFHTVNCVQFPLICQSFINTQHNTQYTV